MPKVAKELGALAVKQIEAPGAHYVGGVQGLMLQVTAGAGRSWLLRAVIGGKRREMGLGSYPAVSLAQARVKASEAREMIRQGVDPVDRQRAVQSTLRAAVLSALTFEQCAASYITAQQAGWKNAKHAQQWHNTLAQHANPVIGALSVQDIGLPQVLAVLEPIWRTKTETASRLRGRIELVLDWATARGYRVGLNPARWRGHLDKMLPKPGKVAKVEHHPALLAADMAAFMVRLRAAEGMGARALEFVILTAARSGEVRGARWSEIDRTEKTWLIPADRMKAGKELCWSSFFGHIDRLFDCRSLLEGIGWPVAQFGVQAHAVVEAHDVVGDISHGLGVVGIVALPDALGLEAQEESFHHRVVPTVALAAHAAN